MYVFCSVALYTGVFIYFTLTLVCYPERISCPSRTRLTLMTYLYGGIQLERTDRKKKISR